MVTANHELCNFFQFWRACSTLARSKVETRARRYPSDNFIDDLESEKPQTDELKSPVCSYNEWDPLEEVIVGRVEGEL